MDKFLRNTMSLQHKIITFLEFIMNGGKVNIDNQTYVWIDHESIPIQANQIHCSIKGLATIRTIHNDSVNEAELHYMDCGGMPFSAFMSLVERIEETEWVNMNKLTIKEE